MTDQKANVSGLDSASAPQPWKRLYCTDGGPNSATAPVVTAKTANY